jgi:hypothetical protein
VRAFTLKLLPLPYDIFIEQKLKELLCKEYNQKLTITNPDITLAQNNKSSRIILAQNNVIMGIDFSQFEGQPVPTMDEIDSLYSYSIGINNIYILPVAEKFLGIGKNTAEPIREAKFKEFCKQHLVYLSVLAGLTNQNFFADSSNPAAPKEFHDLNKFKKFVIYNDLLNLEELNAQIPKMQELDPKARRFSELAIKISTQISAEPDARKGQLLLIKRVLSKFAEIMPYNKVPNKYLEIIKQNLHKYSCKLQEQSLRTALS